MSAYLQIFVRTDRSLEQLLSDIAAAAGITLHAVDDEVNKYIDYSGRVEYAAIEIELSHEFDEESYGIPFPEYPIVITVRDFDRDRQREETLARDIFGKLCQRGYSMLLVFDISVLLDRCDQSGE